MLSCKWTEILLLDLFWSGIIVKIKNNSHVNFLHAFNLSLCGFFLIKNHDLIEKYVALILSKGLIMYSEKRLLIWFPKKIKIKKIYPFLSALYSITTDRHGI